MIVSFKNNRYLLTILSEQEIVALVLRLGTRVYEDTEYYKLLSDCGKTQLVVKQQEDSEYKLEIHRKILTTQYPSLKQETSWAVQIDSYGNLCPNLGKYPTIKAIYDSKVEEYEVRELL